MGEIVTNNGESITDTYKHLRAQAVFWLIENGKFAESKELANLNILPDTMVVDSGKPEINLRDAISRYELPLELTKKYLTPEEAA